MLNEFEICAWGHPADACRGARTCGSVFGKCDTGRDGNRQPIGLYTPITETGAITRAVIYSEFNGSAKYKPDCAFTVKAQDQRFGMTRDNFDTKYWLNGYLKCDWQPFPKIDLAQDGGIFFIGGTPLGKRLLGTLEDVIVDPFDGGEPPGLLAGEDEDGLWRARLPMVVAP